MPLHFWTREGDETVRLYDAPDGHEFTTATATRDGGNEVLRVRREPGMLDRALALVGVDHGARGYGSARVLRSPAVHPGWREYVVGIWRDVRVLDAATHDEDLVGGWETERGGTTGNFTLRSDGSTEGLGVGTSPRWGRAGDVLVMRFPDDDFVFIFGVIGTDERSIRHVYDGWTIHRVR